MGSHSAVRVVVVSGNLSDILVKDLKQGIQLLFANYTPIPKSVDGQVDLP